MAIKPITRYGTFTPTGVDQTEARRLQALAGLGTQVRELAVGVGKAKREQEAVVEGTQAGIEAARTGEDIELKSPIKFGGATYNQYFKRAYNKHYGYATDGAALSPDGNTFMVACAPEYTDSMDIYMSVKKEDGVWSYLEKIEINTPGDERSLFIAGDNQTIYFASNGYKGFGGLDIFKTSRDENGNWGPVINIGKPFNSEEDDYNFIVAATGDLAYFVREGNIYEADISKASSLIKPLPTVLINGIVYDMYGRPVESIVELSDSRGVTKAKTKSNSESGEYAFSIFRKPGSYTETITWNDLEVERTFDIDSGSTALKISHEYEVRDPAMMFVQFDFDKSDITEQYTHLLDSLVSELYANKNLRMYIGGHTDEKGNEEYNLELSRNRVQAVADYLKAHGIPEKIMKLDFYGESIPRVTHGFNKDEINRRVEIRLIDLKKSGSG